MNATQQSPDQNNTPHAPHTDDNSVDVRVGNAPDSAVQKPDREVTNPRDAIGIGVPKEQEAAQPPVPDSASVRGF